jgi:glutathione synthase
VLIIGGKVVPYALARIPKSGETRGNLAAGGRGVAMPLTEREAGIAEALAPVLWGKGLLIVGLDVIGGFLTEVNVTSPTGFAEIAGQTDFDVAVLLADKLEEAVMKRRP